MDGRIRRGDPPPKLISLDDVMRYNDAMKSDPEFRRSVIELIEGMKEGFEYFQGNIQALLTELHKTGTSD